MFFARGTDTLSGPNSLCGAGGHRRRRWWPSRPTHLSGASGPREYELYGNRGSFTREPPTAVRRNGVRCHVLVPSRKLSSALSCATREPPLWKHLMWFNAAGARVSPAPSFNAPAAPFFRVELSAGLRSAVLVAGLPGAFAWADHIHVSHEQGIAG